MLYVHPRTIAQHLANAACALVVGLVFAFVGLNAASGCGQSGGACIRIADLTSQPAPQRVAMAPRHLDW